MGTNGSRRLTAEEISMAFGGVYALREVALAIDAGNWFGLIGPNGSGKTTLLNVLTGIYRPVAGTVRLDGQEITGDNPTSRGRKGLVRTFQHPQLAESLTIEENIMVGGDLAERRMGVRPWRRSRGARRRAREAAELFAISDYGEALPEEVPYGVRKITEVARAAAAEPRVLLLDEPAAGLSSEERTELISAMRIFRENRPDAAVCLIEHDVGLVAALCSELLVLDAGRPLASGGTTEVLNDQRVRDAYLGKEATPADAREGSRA